MEIRVITSELSDGSSVHDVRIELGDGHAIIPAFSARAADQLLHAIADAVRLYTIERVNVY